METPSEPHDRGATSQASAREPSEEEQRESLARVERGGIPLAAERRLRELGERGRAFTSDLAVGDFALCHQLRLQPLSQVMGSSIYQVGYQSMPWSTPGVGLMLELDALSDAWNEVRGRALSRLREEARQVGADSVIGVKLRTGAHDWAENSIEYVVIGTAVRHRERPREHAGDRGEPVLTELSVADYAKLASAGIEPLGIVAWSSVFFVVATYMTQMLSGLGGAGFTRNQELPEFTEGVYNARESVVQQLTAQASALGAGGVIGVRIDHELRRISLGSGRYQRGGLMVTFHALGTAIRETASAAPQPPTTTIELAG